jgi:hypothetical protein
MRLTSFNVYAKPVDEAVVVGAIVELGGIT